MALSLGVLGQTEFGKNAVKLISDARTEIAKVVWPGRGETTQMTIMVLVMILILALVFWGLDSLLSFFQDFLHDFCPNFKAFFIHLLNEKQVLVIKFQNILLTLGPTSNFCHGKTHFSASFYFISYPRSSLSRFLNSVQKATYHRLLTL